MLKVLSGTIFYQVDVVHARLVVVGLVRLRPGGRLSGPELRPDLLNAINNFKKISIKFIYFL